MSVVTAVDHAGAIRERRGVRASVVTRSRFGGVTSVVWDLRWETEPGSIEFCFERPTVCSLAEEIGGRGEMRAGTDECAQGEYFGDGHLTFVAASQALTVRAAEMRKAKLLCHLVDPHETGGLPADRIAAISEARSRSMFKDERLWSCATLLGDGREAGSESDPYAVALSRLFLAALSETIVKPCEVRDDKLTGQALNRVFAQISGDLDGDVTVRALAKMARMKPLRFRRAFRQATGVSLQRWKMDARVRSAQRLLVDNPAEPLAEVATMAGFCDQSHFSRVFQDLVGKTPTAWLRELE